MDKVARSSLRVQSSSVSTSSSSFSSRSIFATRGFFGSGIAGSTDIRNSTRAEAKKDIFIYYFKTAPTHFTIENPCFLLSLMQDIECISTPNATKHRKTEDMAVP